MNVFELFAKLGLDSSDYESGLGRAQRMASSVGSAISGGLRVSAMATTAAIGAASTAVVALTQQSVDAYASYEQLTGGIETLYGDAASSMMDFASQAATTTGQSMNEFMDAAIATSAAMISSVEGDRARAAELTNMSMIDMADNANKLGTDMEAIQNAYRGFSRSNFTMLDNLALGYAGTAEGMQQLLADAQAISGVEYDISSYADIVEAIHVVQEEMGIAGTTSLEASETISGSIGALSASWQNLVTGISNPDADIGTLISDVVEKAKTALDNLRPVMTQALEGVAELINQAAPIIAEELPGLIDTILPPILSAATSIVEAIIQNLPTILTTLTNEIPTIIDSLLAPEIIEAGIGLISALGQGIEDNADSVTDSVLAAVQTIIDTFTSSVNGRGSRGIMETAMTIIQKIGEFLVRNAPALMYSATELIVQFVTFMTTPENITMMIDLSLQLILAIADGIVMAIPQLISVIPEIIVNINIALNQAFPDILATVVSLIGDLALMVLGLVGGLMGDSYNEVIGKLDEIWTTVSVGFDEFLYSLGEWIVNIGESIGQMWFNIQGWFVSGIDSAMGALSGWWDAIAEWFSGLADAALTWASDMIDNFVSGINSGISRVTSAVSNIASSVSSFIGFSEPEEGPLSDFHTYAPDMIDLFTEGIYAGQSQIAQAFDDVLSVPSMGVAFNGNGGAMNGLVNADGSVSLSSLPPIVVQAYFGNEKFDEYVVNSNQRTNYINGGRA